MNSCTDFSWLRSSHPILEETGSGTKNAVLLRHNAEPHQVVLRAGKMRVTRRTDRKLESVCPNGAQQLAFIWSQERPDRLAIEGADSMTPQMSADCFGRFADT